MLQETTDRTTADYNSELLSTWMHDGRSPLTIVRGFSELLCEGAIGGINPQQQIVLENIFHSTNEVIGCWDAFGNYFHLYDESEAPISPMDVNTTQFQMLRQSIIEPAITTLQLIQEKTRLLLDGKYGRITEEQRTSLDAVHRASAYAMQQWQEPIDYFEHKGFN